jgi:GT2 family glycosyltransferase
MEHPEKDVAIVIINYNSSEFTLDCVESIFSNTSQKLSYQIIIVDNASKQEEVLKLENLEDNPSIQILYSKVNLGFGRGNMLGAEKANARYLFFLNNDCVLLNDCLGILEEFCNKNRGAGMCGAQLYSEKQERIRSFNYLPTLAVKFIGPGFLRLFAPQRYPKRQKVYSKPVKVDTVSGSGLFFNNNAFKEIGGFDPNLFFYCEEEDIGERLKEMKWDVYFIPEAKYIHFGGGSSSENFVMFKEYHISLMYFFRKHYSVVSYFFLKILYALKLLRKSLKNKKYLPFVAFIMKGAPMKDSLRYR